MRTKHLVAAIVTALISAPLPAQSVKAGITAWQSANYARAVAIWRPLAQHGDADAQFNLGQAYRLGRGVPLDLPTAKGWFEKAASSGHLDAETTLGLLLFQNGDHAEGLRWLKRAAGEGEPRAMLVYGTALYNGDGVTQDRMLGYAFVSRAAGKGLAPAKDTLSQLDSLMPESDRRKARVLAEAAPRSPPETPKPAKPVRPARTLPPASPHASATAKAPSRRAVETAPRGNWKIQLGAFSQRSAAEALYRRLSTKAALAGRSAFYVSAGSVTRLQVGPFETKTAAAAACSALGTACFPVAEK